MLLSHIKRFLTLACGQWCCAMPSVVLCGMVATQPNETGVALVIYAMTLCDLIILSNELGVDTVFMCPRYVAKLMLDTQRDVGSGKARA